MKKIKIFGKIPVTLIAILLASGLATAGVLTYYAKIVGTATVRQSVRLSEDGNTWLECPNCRITWEYNGPAGATVVKGPYYLKNFAGVPATVKFETSCHNSTPDVGMSEEQCEGITTTYLLLEPSWTTTAHQSGGTDGFDVAISFSMSDDSFTWTFDADMEDPDAQSNLDTVGNSVNLQLDGDDSDNWFYVLYTDGSYMKVEYWTWDWLEQGNIADLGVSVDAEEPGHVVWTIPNSLAADGTIKMMRSQPFGYEFLPPEGRVYTGIGYLPSEPTPITEIALEPKETVNFVIKNDFAIDLAPGTYTIVTQIVPVGE